VQAALEIPYFHHERWDGTGYPRGLRGEEIPIAARLFALVDVYDALINDRPYRKALPLEEVVTHLKSQSGSHFDPNLFAVFLRILAEK
jgi:putative two-component system response regulator